MRRLLAILLVLVPILSAGAQSTSDTLPVPVFLDSQYVADTTITIVNDEDVLVLPNELVQLLSGFLSDRVLADADGLFLDDAVVRPAALDPLGISIRFDWEQLALIAEIPPLARRPQTLSLSSSRPAPTGVAVAPAPFSLIANFDLWSRYTYENVLFETSFTPDVAASIYGAVVEVRGGVRTGDAPFFLDHARASWDFPGIGYRIQGGDLVDTQTGITGVSRLTGISFFREDSIGMESDPVRGVLDRFFLAQDATVAVYVNESRLQRRNLGAGNYELSNVPLGDGINTILVEWEDTEERLVELVVPYDSELLAHRELDAGVSLAIANLEFVRPVLIGYQAYGLTPQLTVGARQGLEMLDLQVDAGVFGTLATRFGTFILEPVLGFGPASRMLVDIPLRYSFLNSSPSAYLSFGLSGAYQFVRAEDGLGSTQTISTGGYVNFALPDGFSVTPRVSYIYTAPDALHSIEGRAALRKSLRGGSSVSADIGLRWENELSFLARVTYSASFPDAQQNLFLQQDLESQEFTAYWSRYAGQQAQDIDYGLSAKVPVDFAEVINLSGQVGYLSPWFRGSLSHGFTGIIEEEDLRNSTSLSLQSAIVLAEDAFAISRPVSDSFTIVVPGETLSDLPVLVSRSGARADLTLNGSSGVMPDLSAYSPVAVRIEPETILLGLEESDLVYVVSPTYRSGTVIRAEPKRNIYAGGILLDEDEEPVAYELGRYESDTGDTGEFFTDEGGYFEMYGLEPGEYSLELSSQQGLRFRATIAPEAEEYVDLGDLVPVSGGSQ